MKIFGLDFTSAPRPSKPITLAEGKLDGHILRVETVVPIDSLDGFEAFLNRKGPWVAGLDFPFGQPQKLITNLSWPGSWAGYVRLVAALGKQGFEELLVIYSQPRPKRDKLHPRAVDIKAKALSPMKLDFTPVAKMFFQGAPRLLKSGASVLPERPRDDNRIVVEAYPALVAGKWTTKKPSYKNDIRSKQSSAQTAARRTILDGICSEKLMGIYGLTLELQDDLAQLCLADASGDTLDAVLCAIQAAWAYRHKRQNYGIPANANKLEGWIVDPALLTD